LTATGRVESGLVQRNGGLAVDGAARNHVGVEIALVGVTVVKLFGVQCASLFESRIVRMTLIARSADADALSV
jgi:hypothetical protein